MTITESIAIILKAYDAESDTYTFGVGAEYDKFTETKTLTGSEIQAIWETEGSLPLFEFAVHCFTESDEYWDVQYKGDPSELVGRTFET
jgi:hypothetical protein